MKHLTSWLVFLLFPFIMSCATVAVSGAGLGIAYTVTNVAYKTFSFPLDQVHKATTLALKKMDVTIGDNSENEKGRKIKAYTEDLEIIIDLEPITSTCTKMKVNAKKGLLFKDKATATEVIYQTNKILEGKSNLSLGLNFYYRSRSTF